MSSWVTALNWGQFTIGHATGVAYTITKATIFIYQKRPGRLRPNLLAA